jgi:hypothetical protein
MGTTLWVNKSQVSEFLMATSGYKSVSRLDSRRAHGWYVRVVFMGELHAKFFSDSQYDSPKEALEAAVEYRDQLEAELGKPRTDRIVSAVNERNNSGVRGVQRVMKRERGYPPYPAYQITWCPEPGAVRRTSISIEKYGEKEALRRAIELRQEKERELYGAVLPAPKSSRRRRTILSERGLPASRNK